MKTEKTDRLENFVQNNRDAFDTFEPPADMFQKISDQVEKRNNKKGKKRTIFFVQRAAAAIIILLAAYGVVDISLGLKNKNNEVAVVEQQNTESNELGEAMLYYASKINSKRLELEEKAAAHPEILEEIKQEFAQLDDEYKSLENDLKEDVSNQMVIEAMIKTARIKLEILETLNREMKRIDDKNHENNETSTQL